jgi:hypothetical protein
MKMMDVNISQYYSDWHWIYKNGDLNVNFQFLWQTNLKRTGILLNEQHHFSPL